MSVPTWVKAIQGMPRLNEGEWRQLGWLSRWLVASRSAVLLMTLTSAVVGGLLALPHPDFSWPLFLLTILGLMLAHATNNLLNDLTDSIKGVDKDNYFRTRYGVQPLESGLLSKKQLLGYITVTGALALAIGLYLMSVRGESVLWLTLAGAFFVLFYTWPLKYWGLGEPSVWLVWGPLMVGGTYLVATGTWHWGAAWVGGIYALAPTAVLFGKHIDKLGPDRSKNIYTVPVLLGAPRARQMVVAMLGLQYLAITLAILSGLLAWPMFLCLATLGIYFKLMRVYREAPPTERPEPFPEAVWPLWYSAYAFNFTRWMSLWFLLGLVLSLWWH